MSPIDRTRDPRTPYTHERHFALAPDADTPMAIVYRPRARRLRFPRQPFVLAAVCGSPAEVVEAWERLAGGEGGQS